MSRIALTLHVVLWLVYCGWMLTMRVYPPFVASIWSLGMFAAGVGIAERRGADAAAAIACMLFLVNATVICTWLCIHWWVV
ncbi:MAG: hypothetical protein KY476_00565 [Planctomycetes bacterium]|nr:hypothetical protein [Planctomycetota bacterium]